MVKERSVAKKKSLLNVKKVGVCLLVMLLLSGSCQATEKGQGPSGWDNLSDDCLIEGEGGCVSREHSPEPAPNTVPSAKVGEGIAKSQPALTVAVGESSLPRTQEDMKKTETEVSFSPSSQKNDIQSVTQEVKETQTTGNEKGRTISDSLWAYKAQIALAIFVVYCTWHNYLGLAEKIYMIYNKYVCRWIGLENLVNF